jgi:hypothetical protein
MSSLLRSRKFVLAVVAIAVQVLALAVPDLRPYAADLGGILFAVVGVATATITLEDSVRLWATRPASLEDAIRSAVDEALKEAFPAVPTTDKVVG